MKKCTEEGCNGNIDPSKTVPLQTGCGGMRSSCVACDTCGALYSSDGSRMYQRGWKEKPFFRNGRVVHEPTEEEEVRYFKVEEAIYILKEDGYPDEMKEDARKELEAIVLREHTKDCHLQKGIGACTCGISFAKECLEKLKVN